MYVYKQTGVCLVYSWLLGIIIITTTNKPSSLMPCIISQPPVASQGRRTCLVRRHPPRAAFHEEGHVREGLLSSPKVMAVCVWVC